MDPGKQLAVNILGTGQSYAYTAKELCIHVRTLRRWQPIVVFEHGLGAADYYGTTPEAVAALLDDCGLAVTLMRRWLRGRRPFTAREFLSCVQERREFYYLAGPPTGVASFERGP